MASLMEMASEMALLIPMASWVVDNVVTLEADDVDVQTFNKLVGAGVSIARGGEREKGRGEA